MTLPGQSGQRTLSGRLFCFDIAIAAKEITMPLFSFRSRSVRRRHVGRSRHGWRRPETLERRTMLTGNDPAVTDPAAAADASRISALMNACLSVRSAA